MPACIFAFIAAHAIGQGAVIWVFISEIFPNRHRAEGQALGSFTHWIFAALLTTFFPKMVTAFAPGYVFLFFCGMMVLQLIWVKTMVPETKGVPLEQMQKRLGIAPLESRTRGGLRAGQLSASVPPATDQGRPQAPSASRRPRAARRLHRPVVPRALSPPYVTSFAPLPRRPPSSSSPSTCRRSTRLFQYGGPRPGERCGTSVASPTVARVRAMLAGPLTSPSSFIRPWQVGQASTSTAKVRAKSSAQGRYPPT